MNLRLKLLLSDAIRFLQVERVKLIQEVVEFVFRLGSISFGLLRQTDAVSHHIATGQLKLLVSFQNGHINGRFALLWRAKKF